jgi:isoquinoline 1-oxidoreductase beta subunit
LVLAIYLDGCAPQTTEPVPVISSLTPSQADIAAGTSVGTPTATPAASYTWTPSIFVKVDNNGVLTVTACRSEMGQGIHTALAMLTAEELDVDWANVRIEQAPTDSQFGDQQTGGSVSISGYYLVMRMAGAKARQLLIKAAAQNWGVEADQCTTQPGFAIHPDGQQKLAYGALVEKAAQIGQPSSMKLKDETRFRLVGSDIGHWDAPQIVTGKATYGLDVRLPGMLYAAIARCPVFGRRYNSYDDSAAKAVNGVRQVITLDDRIAVVADNSWAAIRGRDALQVAWDEGDTSNQNSETFLQATAARLAAQDSAPAGSIDALYQIPYEAHATLEPMNATAWFHDGICEVWAPTQNPQAVQRAVAGAVRLSTGKVIVNVTLLGGGFGRRLQTDYAEEAALVSKAAGAPVQVVWTRADDLQHDFYHPMRLQYFRTSLDRLNMPSPQGNRTASSSVPTGAWRSVDNFPQAYGIQCFLGEMAAALKRDPLEVWLAVYNGRAAAVIQLAADKAGWGSALPVGQGRGLAYHATFGVTHVAMVAEVAVDTGGVVRVRRVVSAVDCGRAVNPDNIAAQMEGGIAFGLTAALKAQITIKDGRVEQSNFTDYPILRIDEMPLVETFVVESDRDPSGIGEMGVPPIAPAVANAVFAATGKRIRHIPILPEVLRA